ncbi:MAG: aminopeptidase P family protein [Bacteroidales bacterium]|nr:aminopeptidase P family protein [Bacteroidales bacterium]
MDINTRLIRAREEMAKRNLDAFIVLTSDPHGSEYTADHWKFREYLSGFNGSAGTLLVMQQYVGLWTDSRYYIQAEKQLRGTPIELFREGQPGVPDYVSYITYILPSGSRVGVDGRTISQVEYQRISEILDKYNIRLEIHHVDFIENVFYQRPPMPTDELTEVNPIVACTTRREKIDIVRKMMNEKKVSHYIISALDDIAWLINLRGSDVEYNPVFYAYMVISPEEEHLYIDPHKLSRVVSNRLAEDGIKMSLYDHFINNLRNLPKESTVYYDPTKVSALAVAQLPNSVVRVEGRSLVGEIKSHKTEAEIANIRSVHIRDGVAMVQLLNWIEKEVASGNRITELDIAEKQRLLRMAQPRSMCESFAPIVAVDANAAIVHYSPSIETNTALTSDSILLIDSGGHYADGTTDITRTIALGEISAEFKRAYTYVLKSHIALASAVFPKGAYGIQLDAVARQPMWKAGLNFGHGTGHGVGYCLNVHEAPYGIRSSFTDSRFDEGILVSDEPGVYIEGKFGIRIENLIFSQPMPETPFGKFIKFETITLCPIDTRPVDVDLLTEEERLWLNDYHKTVYARLAPKLNGDDLDWLQNATREI